MGEEISYFSENIFMGDLPPFQKMIYFHGWLVLSEIQNLIYFYGWLVLFRRWSIFIGNLPFLKFKNCPFWNSKTDLFSWTSCSFLKFRNSFIFMGIFQRSKQSTLQGIFLKQILVFGASCLLLINFIILLLESQTKFQFRS